MRPGEIPRAWSLRDLLLLYTEGYGKGDTMSIGFLIGLIFLISAVIYAAYMLRSIIKDPKWFNEAPGSLKTVMGIEAIVFFLCTVGVSDFLLNTIVCRRLNLSDAGTQPDNNICAGLVPGGLISFLYLRNADVVDGKLLLVFMLCMIPGSIAGSLAVGRMEGEFIRRAMVIFLSITMVFLLIRTFGSAGIEATANTLGGWKLALIGVEAFCAGFINMLGIPAKPMTATTALLLGLSPLTTLAITLGALPMACVAGGINIAPRKRYNPKLILSSIVAGCPAAAIGCLAAISIDTALLNAIILVVLATAIISLIKK